MAEDKLHPSHLLRGSDASSYDMVCIHCGFTDHVPGGWGKLSKPCPNAPKIDKDGIATGERDRRTGSRETSFAKAAVVLSRFAAKLTEGEQGAVVQPDGWIFVHPYSRSVATIVYDQFQVEQYAVRYPDLQSRPFLFIDNLTEKVDANNT